jgi:hypothetical protein
MSCVTSQSMNYAAVKIPSNSVQYLIQQRCANKQRIIHYNQTRHISSGGSKYERNFRG